MTFLALYVIVSLVGRVAGSMCCMDKTKTICERDDHPCQCGGAAPYGCSASHYRDEVEKLEDGRLDAAILKYKADSGEDSRRKKYVDNCPESTIKNGLITLTGCTGAWATRMEGVEAQDPYYSCIGYDETAKVVYNTCGNKSPNLFWSEAPGSYGMCSRLEETNTCAGGELHVSMYMGQIKADGNEVLKWYKKASFDVADSTCNDQQKSGYRWRHSLGKDSYKESCKPTQMEFEEPINWYTADSADTTYKKPGVVGENHLGVGWAMMQIRFAEHQDKLTTSQSINNGMCAFSDGEVGDSGITECKDNVIHPGGAKFLLELDQKHGYTYPHEAGEAYWSACSATKTGSEQCLQCFVVDYSTKGEGMEVTADMDSKSIVATETRNGVNTTFKYSFEDIVNIVQPTSSFEPTSPDFVYDFKKAKVILETDLPGDKTRAYVCLDRLDYDITEKAGNSFPCPQHGAGTCQRVFYYDPEMTVTLAGDNNNYAGGASEVAASSVVLAALAIAHQLLF